MATTKKYDLSYASIDRICQDIDSYCKDTKVLSKEATRMRLMAEEALLQYHEIADEDTEVEVIFSKTMFRTRVVLEVYCDLLNPFEEEDAGLMKSLTGSAIDDGHYWRYVKGIYAHLINGEGRNEIQFRATRNKKINNPLFILLCLTVGFLLALILRAVLSPDFLNMICVDYILPLANAYTGILCVMSILLIFFSIPLCMVQYGNAATFQKDVGRLLFKFILVVLALVLLTLFVAIGRYGVTKESLGFGTVFKPIFDVFIGFVPSNLIGPFLNYNCMQVLIIGALFGIAFLIMGDQAKGIVKAFDKINLIAVITNGWLAKFVGIYSGLMVFYFISTNTTSPSQVIWIIVVTILIGIVAYFAAALTISIKLKVKLSVILKKFLPSFLINLSSASVGASFIVFFDELAKDCGVEINYTAVSCNLGTVFFKPIYSVFFAATGLLLAAETGGISVSVAIQICILSAILPAAIPNVPGGASSIIIVLLSSLGFASGYTDTVISINSLLQFIIVPLNIFLLQCIIVLQASKVGKIDQKILRRPT